MAMSLTIPDCRDEKWQRCFPLTFAMSILWIGILSFLMVDFAARAGCILGIPEFLMGLTVLAAGTSVPDALSSVLVARNGQGNMAVCNVLGSNVFNILLGLGLPWLIAASMAGEPYVAGGGDVMEPLLILFGYLVMFIVIVAAFGWRLTPGMGYATTTTTTVTSASLPPPPLQVFAALPPALLHGVERGQARRLPVGEVHPRRRDRAAERDFPGGFRALNCARRGFHEGFRHLACQRL